MADIFKIVVAFICLGLGVAKIWYQVDWASVYYGVPGWDESSHIVDGAIVTKLIADGAFFEAIQHIYQMNLWPPFFRLLNIPLFAMFGYETYLPRLVVIGMFLGSAVGLYAVSLRVSPAYGIWTGCGAVALWLSSPFLTSFLGLAMLEIPGAFLTVWSFYYYLSFLQSQNKNSLRLCFLLATCLFFTKYNYGFMWLMVLLAHMVLSDKKLLFFMVSWLRGLRGNRRVLTSPGIILAVGYIFVLGKVAFFGGFEFQLFGVPVSIRKLGNPSYFFLLVLGLITLTRYRLNFGKLRGWYLDLSCQWQSFLVLVALPLFFWCVNPVHWAAVTSFLSNHERLSHKGGALTTANLLYYPLILSQEFFSNPSLIWIALAAGIFGLAFFLTQSKEVRVVIGSMWVYFLLLVIHKHQAARHLIIAFPWVCLAVPLLPVIFAEFLGRSQSRWLPHLVRGVVAVLIASAVFFPVDRPSKFSLRNWMQPQESMDGALALCRLAENGVKTLVLGYWHDLSPGLTTMVCLKERPDVSFRYFPKAPRLSKREKQDADYRYFWQSLDTDRFLVLNYHGEKRRGIHDLETAHLSSIISRLLNSSEYTTIASLEVGSYEILRVRKADAQYSTMLPSPLLFTGM